MNRRQLLKLTALGAVAAAGAGYWALPSGEAPGALNLAGVQRVLAGLVDKQLVSLEGWSPAEVFNHCAQSIEYSISGYPELKPGWFRHSVGPLAFSLFAARGAMRHPLDQAIPGAAALGEPATQALALQRLRQAFADFASYRGTLQPHFAYGLLSHADYARAHVLHLYDHLSLIRLA
ncbi:Tat (twin-arginine translocation) pathway signal sequence [Pseudomonas benzenivorans]|nr:DUF1569 domain-containing protein [Pseudomonas benzenivorans]SDH90483.1 Tat (twin-arginine translocation) pathway signal sequence [Pseudomonas benzenivorans]